MGDATAVDDFYWAVGGTVFDHATVKTGATKVSSTGAETSVLVASYDFQQPIIDSITPSGLSETVSFVGDYTVTVPTP